MSSHVWISTMSEEMYNGHYGDAVRTWHNLPGRKIMFFDGTPPDLPFMEMIDYWSVIDRNNSWFSKKRSKKIVRLSYKAWVMHWAIKNLDYDRVIWIDADVSVHKPVPEELLSNGDNLWSTMSFDFSSNPNWAQYGQQAETGLQIFNRRHPDIHRYIDEYIGYYQTERVYELPRAYDNWVSRDMMDSWPLDNLILDPSKERAAGEDTLQYTRFKGYMTHFLGKSNKENIPETA
jgi:hypothetical protein